MKKKGAKKDLFFIKKGHRYSVLQGGQNSKIKIALVQGTP